MTETRYLIIDRESREWAEETLQRRRAAIETAEEALKKIHDAEKTISDAAGLLEAADPMTNRVLSHAMIYEDLADAIREDIAVWTADTNELEREIASYKAKEGRENG